MLEPLHPELDFVPDTFLIFLIQELASKLPPSKLFEFEMQNSKYISLPCLS
jgi:hypothetical protein